MNRTIQRETDWQKLILTEGFIEQEKKTDQQYEHTTIRYRPAGSLLLSGHSSVLRNRGGEAYSAGT